MTQQSTVGVRVAARTPSPPGQLGPEPTPQTVPARRIRVSLSLLLGLALAVLLSVVHLAQGTADVRADDLLELLLGKGTERAADVAVASRLPRLLAGVVVGVCLGMAGAALQSVARNALASPDTLAVNAGAFLAVTAVAAAGFSLPVLASAGLAFVGGLAAAGLVLALSAGGSGPTRMVLAGSAIALALSALTSMMLLLFAQETRGLFAWGSGSLAQIGFGVLRQTAVLVVLGCAALLLLARRLDLLSLGDDTSSVLGVDPRRTRITAVVCTVLLSAVAVTVAGPIGFVGLCAPALVRLVAPAVPGLLHHRALLPMSALLGVVIVLGADVLLRVSVGSVRSVAIPTGVATTLLGAVFLVVLATRRRDSGPTRHAPAARSARLRSRTSYSVLTGAVLALTAGAALLGSLLGDTTLLAGDVVNWLSGRAGPGVSFVLETRMPRVTAALLAGAALALAGATIQVVCRNPLAEPGIIGVAGGAGLGAVLSITLVAGAGAWTIAGSALVGAVGASALVFGLAARGGLQADRLVLVGVGVSAAAAGATTFLVVLTDPFNAVKAITWLSGSTYGVTFDRLVPLVLILVLMVPLLAGRCRDLDLLALDDDTPRVLGVRLVPTRLLLLGAATLLTAFAVASVGVIGFVGLVAPHAARAIAGSRHTRVLPIATMLGATVVSLGDTLGRTVVAPAQLPAGLLTALIGTPYFVWLLWRSRGARQAWH